MEKIKQNKIEIKKLSIKDVESIIALENLSWINGLRASPETIIERLGKGHIFLGLFYKNELIGKICFVISDFEPEKSNFPEKFSDFSDPKNSVLYNSAFVYNLDVHPKYRNAIFAKKLIYSVFVMAYKLGLDYVVADGRMPSYNGSAVEGIDQDINLHTKINSSIQGLSLRDLVKDPVVGFYSLVIPGINLWKVIPNFIPEDLSSGGYRAVLYKQIRPEKSELTLSEEWNFISRLLYDRRLFESIDSLLKENKVNSVLELACGNGNFLVELKKRGYDIKGIDSDPFLIGEAKKLIKDDSFIMLDVVNIDKLKGDYDCIICRGNSLGGLCSWNATEEMEINYQTFIGFIRNLFMKIYLKLSKDGIIYLDTVSLDNDCDIVKLEINTGNIFISGKRETNFQSRRSYTFGEGIINSKYFKGGSSGFYISPEEIVSLLREVGFTNVSLINLLGENTYQGVLAKK